MKILLFALLSLCHGFELIYLSASITSACYIYQLRGFETQASERRGETAANFKISRLKGLLIQLFGSRHMDNNKPCSHQGRYLQDFKRAFDLTCSFPLYLLLLAKLSI